MAWNCSQRLNCRWPLPIIIDMGDVIPQTLRALAGDQAGVVTRQQALGAGMSDGAIVARIKFGRWQRVHVGVYATFTGPVTRDARLWAAALAAGPGAKLSHETAAEINRLTDRQSPFIHVTIPANRRITQPKGVIIHMSSNLTFGWRFARGVPPYTFAEETVVDLVHAASDLNDVIACITGGFAKRKVSEGRLRAVATARKRLRWRGDLNEIIQARAGGAHSVIEYRYDHDVEQGTGCQAPPSRSSTSSPTAAGDTATGTTSSTSSSWSSTESSTTHWSTGAAIRTGTTTPPRPSAPRSGMAGWTSPANGAARPGRCTPRSPNRATPRSRPARRPARPSRTRQIGKQGRQPKKAA